MAEITASMVRELREKTDAPMMECKKALVEAEGILDKAEEILRVRLGNKAAKSSARIAAEGVIATYISDSAKLGAMVEVNCETDFVAKNDDFLAFADNVAKLIAEKNPIDIDALLALPMADGDTAEEIRVSLVGKIGENVSIRRFERIETDGQLAQYIHGKKSGAMVNLSASDATLGKDIAMHIVASKPAYICKDDVPAEVIAKERNIYTAQTAESGKSADIVAKMVDGRITKFLAEISLLEQTFVKNPEQTITALLKSKDAKIYGFTLYVVGEGIEKKTTDFAAEVAAQVAVTK